MVVGERAPFRADGADVVNRRILVVGMHRSGTSVLTRVLNLLGLPLCVDALEKPRPDNPGGHWESYSLFRFNEQLLMALGGNWHRPPSLRAGWEECPKARTLRARADSLFAAAYPTNDWVWKDPRICLTLPFWRPIAQPTAAVLVIRHPSAIAASLRQRDNLPQLVGLALWERYMRSALQSISGMPVVVVRYRELVASPAAAVVKLVEDFARIGIGLDGERRRAVQAITPALDHGGRSPIRLTTPQRQLLTLTDRLPDVSPSFARPDLPQETRWAPMAFLLGTAVMRATARASESRLPAEGPIER